MSGSRHVLAVCGSAAADSVTRVALERVLQAIDRPGVTTQLLDLRDYDLPTFDPDAQDAGDAPALRAELREADAVVLGTPMYHGSYSSTLKTALDYASFDEFEDCTVGLVGVAGGSFPTRALDHLRAVTRALHARPVREEVAIPNSHSAVEDGDLADDELLKRVESFADALVSAGDLDDGREAVAFAERSGCD